MTILETNLKGCFVLKPKVFQDSRGYFFESFNQKEFEEKTGLSVNFVQENQSKSFKGVLRGLHFQKEEYAQAKLVSVTQGRVLDVAVDIRKDSKTFGKHFSIMLDTINKKQLFVPRGFAHGFIALEDNTIFNYKCDNYYDKNSEQGIIYNDEQLNIDWNYPTEKLRLSEKDIKLPTLKTYLNEH